jgi:hypothetical protein
MDLVVRIWLGQTVGTDDRAKAVRPKIVQPYQKTVVVRRSLPVIRPGTPDDIIVVNITSAAKGIGVRAVVVVAVKANGMLTNLLPVRVKQEGDDATFVRITRSTIYHTGNHRGP